MWHGIFSGLIDAVLCTAVRFLALTVLLLAPTIALAQNEVCDPAQRDCGCERNWGCWDLLYTTKGTVLGVRGTATRISSEGDAPLDAAFLASYATEHYGTRNGLTGHFQAFGSIGGGTAGNEGSLGGAVDFGYRFDITKLSGPFARIGANAMLFGNRSFQLSMFEPLQGRAGYQFLDGDTLIETGLTGGLVVAGKYDESRGGARSLARSAEVGAYAAMHLSAVRFDAGLAQLSASASGSGTPIDLVRFGLCGYLHKAALCGNLLFARGEVGAGQRTYRRVGSLYLGLTLGLTP